MKRRTSFTQRFKFRSQGLEFSFNQLFDLINSRRQTFQINRFYTHRFFEMARKHLSTSGVLSFSMLAVLLSISAHQFLDDTTSDLLDLGT